MLITPEWTNDRKTLIIRTTVGGLAYISDAWPEHTVRIHDLLEALLGQPVNGWYPYHEPDHRFLFTLLDVVTRARPQDLKWMAIADRAQIDSPGQDAKRVVAASIAVTVLAKAFDVPKSAARQLVRMNLRKISAAA